MSIAIDFSAIGSTGTQVYARGFLPAFSQISTGHVVEVFATGELIDDLRSSVGAHVEFVTIPKRSAVNRILWQQTALPLQLKARKTAVLLAPFDISPLSGDHKTVLAVRNPIPTAQKLGLVKERSRDLHSRTHFWLSQRSCRRAEVVFYPTAYAAGLLGDAMNVSDSKRRVVNHGTDHDFWSNANPVAPLPLGIEGAPYVLFVSRLYPQKQPELLIRAFSRLSMMKNLQLVIAGGETYSGQQRSLSAIADRHGVAGRVHFLDNIGRDEIRALYRHASVFVLPSIMETFGHPFVEAMATGAPVIAADTGFARELCRAAASYFSPVDDESALAERMQEVMSSTSLMNQMKSAGLSESKRFSWRREARETLTLLESCL